MSKAKSNKKGSAANEEQENLGGYIVKQEFRDKNDYNTLYNVGDDVSHLPDERLKELVEKGLIQDTSAGKEKKGDE